MLSLLPTVECLSPWQTKQIKALGRNVLLFWHVRLYCYTSSAPSEIGMDEKEFKSSTFQRVFQYLKGRAECKNLDQFKYSLGSIEGNPAELLDICLKYAAITFSSFIYSIKSSIIIIIIL